MHWYCQSGIEPVCQNFVGPFSNSQVWVHHTLSLFLWLGGAEAINTWLGHCIWGERDELRSSGFHAGKKELRSNASEHCRNGHKISACSCFFSTLVIWMRMKHESRIFSHGLRFFPARVSYVVLFFWVSRLLLMILMLSLSVPQFGKEIWFQIRSVPHLMKDRLNIWRPAIRWIARMNWVGQTSTCPTGTLWHWAKSLRWSEKNPGGEKA